MTKLQLCLAILDYVGKNESSRTRSGFLRKFVCELDDSLAEYDRSISERTIIDAGGPKDVPGGRSNSGTKGDDGVGHGGEESTETGHESGGDGSEPSYGRVAGPSGTIRSTRIRRRVCDTQCFEMIGHLEPCWTILNYLAQEVETPPPDTRRTSQTPTKKPPLFDPHSFTTPFLSPQKEVLTLERSVEMALNDDLVKETLPTDGKTMVKLLRDSLGEKNLQRLKETLTVIQSKAGPTLTWDQKKFVPAVEDGGAQNAIRRVAVSFENARQAELQQSFTNLYVMEAHRVLHVDWTQLNLALDDADSIVSQHIRSIQELEPQPGKQRASYLSDELTKELYGGWSDGKDKTKKKNLFKAATDYGHKIQCLVDGFGHGILGLCPPDSSTL